MDVLNRGELAELLSISVAQLRHYEDNGLIEPDYIAENGYRKYGKQAIYRLSYILYLRAFDLSIKEIKGCLMELSQEEIVNLFKDKKKKMESEIHRLTSLVEHMSDSFELLEMKKIREFNIEIHDDMVFKVMHKAGENAEMSTRLTYEVFKGMPSLYKTDFSLVYDHGIYYYAMRVHSRDPKSMVLKKGRYLSFKFTVPDYPSIEEAYEEFAKYIQNHDLVIDNILIVEENSLCSITHPESMFYVMMARLIEE